jgi:hypothetical protein
LQAFYETNAVPSNWHLQATTDWSTNAAGPMPAAVYVGICCTAHNNNGVTATDLTYYYTASFANYGTFTPPTNGQPATLTAKVTGGNVVISWSPAGGTLQSTTTLSPAAWTPVGTANPSAPIPISGAADKFFRVGP